VAAVSGANVESTGTSVVAGELSSSDDSPSPPPTAPAAPISTTAPIPIHAQVGSLARFFFHQAGS
jgi:hypothetical protein